MESLKSNFSKSIDPTSSISKWTGRKIGGSHEGTIHLRNGELQFDNDQLVGGKFEIDMNTIAVTDLTGDMQAKLEGHLKSDDFFSVEQHPIAHLKITDVQSQGQHYQVSADLTVKGIKHPVSFPLEVSENGATTTLTIDRSKYNVKYGSKSFFKSLGDNLIHDNFDVEVDLKF
ncbi:lipid-binding protein [Nonlabens spongiae]|uniref:Lipid-binding protein n=1 Tax=Nonlabens spongiae TaxID=331648 RepID=A0A1W6MNE2_9FLAO|nr:YceI family protein [Nonlabens spongiae]ARN79133.1 lipid-binding protein [Nonlabens spongiae]